jgi:hypothetical protein
MARNPKKTVEVGVSLSDSPGAKMEVRVTPWTVWTSSNPAEPDWIEWKRVKINGESKIRVKEIEILTGSDWPFDGAKPGKGAQPKTGAREAVQVPYTLPYSIVITFLDEAGDERTVTVDPDMVIEY